MNLSKRSSIFTITKYQIISILAIAFVIRIIIALGIDTPVISDDAVYQELGLSIHGGNGFSLSGTPTAYRPPGYPFSSAYVIQFSDFQCLR